MDANHKATVYIRLRKRLSIRPGEAVTLGSAARLLADSAELEEKLSKLEIYRHTAEDGNRAVVDTLHMIKLIGEVAPTLQIEVFGDPQILLIVEEKESKPRKIVLVFTWLLLFFGAGLAIMNFHEDVSMYEVQVRITELVTGTKSAHPLWFQIPYSLGIGLGMMLFFNHLFRRRLNEEPNPLEVELYSYQESVNTYVIAEEMSRLNEKRGTRSRNRE